MACSSISTRLTNAIVDVDLTSGASETYGTGAFEGVDQVVADSAI